MPISRKSFVWAQGYARVPPSNLVEKNLLKKDLKGESPAFIYLSNFEIFSLAFDC